MKNTLFLIAAVLGLFALLEEHGARNTSYLHLAERWHSYAIGLGHISLAVLGLAVLVAGIEYVAYLTRQNRRQAKQLVQVKHELYETNRRHRLIRFMER